MSLDIVKERLQQAFSPTHLEVIDDSDQHKGHVSYQSGAGHYTIIISASCFNNLGRVHAHRKIYAVLNDLMPLRVHALRICIK